MNRAEKSLLSGNEAVALAARHAGVHMGVGYPGTPSTEILESFAGLPGEGVARWSPNEKTALEVALGAAFGGARALCTMKHVGVNVAADPLFTAAYTGVSGALVLISADDPGLASSQNEQDNRRYAVAAGVPMLEPADSQQAYDLTLRAIEISERWQIPVMLRMTTRVCHSKTVVRPRTDVAPPPAPRFERKIEERVMIPAYARIAHPRLRRKLAEIAAWAETAPVWSELPGEPAQPGQASSGELGIITSGISAVHAREAAPGARLLQLQLTHPLPMNAIRRFASGVRRALVVEEGDPVLVDTLHAAGIAVEGKAEMYRFGELDVARVRRIVARDESPEPRPTPGKPPELCPGCAHRTIFEMLRDMSCIVAGDIGCYTLGVLPPFSAMDTCVCMGASITVGLGLRAVLPQADARRVVSVIGDSTFVHSGLTGLAEMIYNPPATGHVVLILDNGTTAMTGMQEHPGTGRTLDHQATGKLVLEDVARGMGIGDVQVIDPIVNEAPFRAMVRAALDDGKLHVIIARRNCLLAAGDIKRYERAAATGTSCATGERS